MILKGSICFITTHYFIFLSYSVDMWSAITIPSLYVLKVAWFYFCSFSYIFIEWQPSTMIYWWVVAQSINGSFFKVSYLQHYMWQVLKVLIFLCCRLLQQFLQSVYHGLSDKDVTVRGAALFALGQFSEHLQVCYLFRIFLEIYWNSLYNYIYSFNHVSNQLTLILQEHIYTVSSTFQTK